MKKFLPSLLLIVPLVFSLACKQSGSFVEKGDGPAVGSASPETSRSPDGPSIVERPPIVDGPPVVKEGKAPIGSDAVPTPVLAADEPPPPPPAPTPVKSSQRAPISGGVLNGKAISLPKPPYPAIARAAHAAGTVTVQVTIDESGKVISARAIAGHPLLQQAAVQAAYGARFTPTQLSGQPVKVTGVVTYNFTGE